MSLFGNTPSESSELHRTYTANLDHLSALKRALSRVATVFGRGGSQWGDAARGFAGAHRGIHRLLKVNRVVNGGVTEGMIGEWRRFGD